MNYIVQDWFSRPIVRRLGEQLFHKPKASKAEFSHDVSAPIFLRRQCTSLSLSLSLSLSPVFLRRQCLSSLLSIPLFSPPSLVISLFSLSPSLSLSFFIFSLYLSLSLSFLSISSFSFRSYFSPLPLPSCHVPLACLIVHFLSTVRLPLSVSSLLPPQPPCSRRTVCLALGHALL